jgi:coniferyl-aldehyde dehydrogenase
MNIIHLLKITDDYSSIINQRHFDRINSLVEDAREKGADINEINPSNEDFLSTTIL